MSAQQLEQPDVHDPDLIEDEEVDELPDQHLDYRFESTVFFVANTVIPFVSDPARAAELVTALAIWLAFVDLIVFVFPKKYNKVDGHLGKSSRWESRSFPDDYFKFTKIPAPLGSLKPTRISFTGVVFVYMLLLEPTLFDAFSRILVDGNNFRLTWADIKRGATNAASSGIGVYAFSADSTRAYVGMTMNTFARRWKVHKNDPGVNRIVRAVKASLWFVGFITVVVLAVPLHTPAPFVFVAEHFIIVAMRATFPSYGLNVNLHDCIAWGTIFTKDTVAFVWQFFLNLVAPKARDGSRAAAPGGPKLNEKLVLDNYDEVRAAVAPASIGSMSTVYGILIGDSWAYYTRQLEQYPVTTYPSGNRPTSLRPTDVRKADRKDKLARAADPDWAANKEAKRKQARYRPASAKLTGNGSNATAAERAKPPPEEVGEGGAESNKVVMTAFEKLRAHRAAAKLAGGTNSTSNLKTTRP